MELKIDGVRCDLGNAHPALPGFDVEQLIRIGESEEQCIELRLPATPRNARLFAPAGELHPGVRFNAAEHRATLSEEGEVLFEGVAALLSSRVCETEEGYRLAIRAPQSGWSEQAAERGLEELGIDFRADLTPSTIAESWSSGGPVVFLPVERDRYPTEPSTLALTPVQRILSVEEYHPFLSVAQLVEAIFAEAGYTVRSRFFESEFFQSLYMSGAYATRDTVALRRNMDFLARRQRSATAAADSRGRVYANPYKTVASVGNFVETATPGVSNEEGTVLLDPFTNNGCFGIDGEEILFRPTTGVTASFEFGIRYTTDYRIASRTRLTGFDSVYLGPGCDMRSELTNRAVDRRGTLRSNFQYRVLVFDHTEGNAYRLYGPAGSGLLLAEFDERSALFVTPTTGSLAGQELFYRPAGAGAYTLYPGDWAIYDGSVGERGRMEVAMTLRTAPERITTAGRRFSGIYFHGAEEGMELTLSHRCTLRPDFSAGPGLGSMLEFADVARHGMRQSELLEALQHLFNLRFLTHEASHTVWIEPADDLYALGQEVDWSGRIDAEEPIVVSDAARGAGRTLTLRYRAGDGPVSRLERDEGAEVPFGGWSAAIGSALCRTGEQTLSNPLFAPSVSETGLHTEAPSARVLRIGNRDAAGEEPMTPRIVRYFGLHPLPEGERWGAPAGGSYPRAAFHDSETADGATLSFADRDGLQGLHRYYDTQITQQQRGQQLTLSLHWQPHEVTGLRKLSPVAVHAATRYAFRIDGERVVGTLRSMEAYDPQSRSTRCTFDRLPG